MWRQSKRVKPVSLILVSIMLWHFAGLGVFAQAHSVENRQQAKLTRRAPFGARDQSHFDAFLGELKDVVKRGAEQTKAAPEKGFAAIDKLVELKGKLIAENEKNQQQFHQFESSLKQQELPLEILNRQAQSVREYEARYAVLMARLDSIESAQNQSNGWWAKLTGKNKDVKWDEVLGETLKFLEENTPHPYASRFDSKDLPHRALKVNKPLPPKLTREDWLKTLPKDSVNAGPASSGPSALFATTPATPADLAETIEVKFTQEIQSLANSLDKNPVKIFNWVRNNIEFVPTWGSIQGAQVCLENRAGNAFDIASLLIALLRASGIPARYQMGTIEVSVEKFKNWAGGFTNTEAAASLFASGGIPSVVRRVNQTGQVVTVKLEHVWVKAFVSYAPSGGSVNRQADAWVEMDPSFKQHAFFQPVNFEAAVPSDFRAFVDQLASTATINPATGSVTKVDRQALASFLTQQADRRLSYVSTNLPNATSREIFGGGVITQQSLAILAAAPPYRVLARANESAEIPDGLRHKVTISLGANPPTPDSADQWSYTATLPEMAGKSVSLLYVPASQVDEQLMASLLVASGATLPLAIPSSVNLVAQLYVGDQLKAAGRPLRAGSPVISQIKLFSPTVSLPVITNSMIAGEHAAICLDLQGISPAQMKTIKQGIQQLGDKIRQGAFPTITRHDIANLLLSSSITAWFAFMDWSNAAASTAASVVTIRYPSVGMAFSKQKVNSLFGAAISISNEGLNMDIDGDVVVSGARDGDLAKTVALSLTQGAVGSALEARIPETFLSIPTKPVRAISTMDALALANDQGIPIFRIDAANAPTIIPMLQIASTDLTEIQDAIAAGLLVTVSERAVNSNGQTILGMIIEDPRTGSAAFLISGGTNGSLAVLRETLLDYMIALPQAYEGLERTQFQWFPEMTEAFTYVMEEALEALETAIVPNNIPAGCYSRYFILHYLGTRLVYLPGNPNSCGICLVVTQMGVLNFAKLICQF